MKKLFALVLVFALALSSSAFAELEIVCSLFPTYEFAKHIAGDRADVTKLLPHGMDSHHYEPSARDMLNAKSADLFIYTDDHLEGWVKNLSGGLNEENMVRCAQGIDLEQLNEDWEKASGHEHDHDHGHSHSYDAHIWLDLTLCEIMCENILAALIEADPEGESVYRANCESYIQELRALDSEFAALFESTGDSKLYFGGKFAYSHFLRRYNVSYETAYPNCSDEGEPGIRQVIEIAQEMSKVQADVVFTDEMSSGEVARAIAERTGAEVLLFHTAHNVSREEFEKGITFLDIMRMNLENVKAALAPSEGLE